MELWEKALREDLRRHEGEVLHAYRDHLGFWTIGVGRLIDSRKGGGISKEESAFLFENDVSSRIARLQREITFWDQLSGSQRRGLVNMSFQLGVDGLMKFEQTLLALQRGDGEAAERRALQSKWARKDTPKRAAEVAALLKGGD
jgi:lysozyme